MGGGMLAIWLITFSLNVVNLTTNYSPAIFIFETLRNHSIAFFQPFLPNKHNNNAYILAIKLCTVHKTLT